MQDQLATDSEGVSMKSFFVGFFAFLLATACVATHPKTASQMSADHGLADRVEAALNSDPVYFFRHVDVRADEGNVWLSGYVWSDEAIWRAELIASRVPGVISVTDELALEREGARSSH